MTAGTLSLGYKLKYRLKIGRKVRNFMDISSDTMTILCNASDKEYRGFVRIEPVRRAKDIILGKKRAKRKKMRGLALLCCSPLNNLGFSQFLKQYIKENEEIGKQYKNNRYGTCITLMLPRGFHNYESTKKVAISFANKVTNGNKGIKWFAFHYTMKSAFMIRFWFCDRFMYEMEKEVYPTYTKTQYIDSSTGKFCGKNNPNAVAKFKKGDIRDDVKPSYRWFSVKKTRLFDGSNHYIQRVRKQLLEYAVQSVRDYRVKIIEGLMIERKKSNYPMSKWIRRCVSALNNTISYVERELSYMWHYAVEANPLSVQDLAYQIAMGGFMSEQEYYEAKKSVRSPFMKEVVRLWEKYKKIFSDYAFNYNGEVIPLRKIRCDKVEKNCDILKSMFNSDLMLLFFKAPTEVKQNVNLTLVA